MDLYITPYIDWTVTSDPSHPEETNRVRLVKAFEHTSDAKLLLWEGRDVSKLWKTKYYTIELRCSKGNILYKEQYDRDEESAINYDLETQMEIYPTQKLW